mgnify:CR=1 FL=1
MISQCPHCRKNFDFSKSQRAKIEKALAGLGPGKVLKLSCPHCKHSLELNADGEPAGGVMQDILYASGAANKAGPPPKPVKPPPSAPQAPDISWLQSGKFEATDDWVEDVPTALLLMPDGQGRTMVAKAFKGLGYQIMLAKSSADAIERMRFVRFAAVAFHLDAEGGDLARSAFHRHMREMAMEKRRYIYYVLMGPRFRTLYDLEAMAHSANLVVNNKEIPHMPVILKKGLHDYEELFNPLIMILREHGKR